MILRALVGDVYIGFYSYDSRCRGWRSTVKLFDGCWSARWNKTPILPGYPGYHLWQFGTTSVSGIGKVDTSKLAPGLTISRMLSMRAK